ncbi:P-loop NTPase fold protein [Neisseria dentiae]|uniref:P-loop NTPase fold protein n=4 Tax=Neisseria dentiae TaxID=194197 RepID=UPI0035A1D2C1
MNNQNITEFLEYYLNLPQSPEYAVMIDAPWGAGKTYFIRNFLEKYYENKDSKKERFLWVSLYGLSSIEEIEAAIFAQLHPMLSHKGMALTGKLLKEGLKAAINLDLSTIKIPDYLKDIDNTVLIFDDVERCSIEMNKLLGYLNHFVENQNHKMILIANEQEIETHSEQYKKIKEKLIGKVFKYEASSVEKILSDFIKNYFNDKSLITLFYINHIKLIVRIFNLADYSNIRVLKQALQDFERLYKTLDQEILDQPELMSSLLRVFLILFFEEKSSGYSIEKIFFDQSRFVKEYSKNGKESLSEEENKLKKIHDKYQDIVNFSWSDILLGNDIWLAIVQSNIINQKAINSSLKNSRYFQYENRSGWYRLWDYQLLAEDEFNQTFNNCLQEIEQNKISELGELQHYFGLFLFFSENNIRKAEAEEAMEQIQHWIGELAEDKKLPDTSEYPSWWGESWDNRRVTSSEQDRYKEFLDFVKNKIQEQEKSMYPDKVAGLLKDMVDDVHAFSEKLIADTKGTSIYRKNPILAHIDIEEFFDKFYLAIPENRYRIISALERRYEYWGRNKELEPEKKWLQNLLKKINGQKLKFQDHQHLIFLNRLELVVEEIVKNWES